MKVKYFQTDDGFLAVTDKSPKDFKGVLFSGKIGTDPLTVREECFTPEQVLKFREVPKADVPAVWMLGFGYEKPVAPKKPEPVVVEEIVEEPLFDPETFDLMAYIPVKQRRVINPPADSPRAGFNVGLIIGLIIVFYFLMMGWL